MESSIEKIEVRFSTEKKHLRFFDANAWIGRSYDTSGLSLGNPTEIVAQMNYYGIEKAIVSHTLSRYYDPLIGNERLIEEINGIARLQACFILPPPSTKEMGVVDEYLDHMLTRGVRTIRLFPASHHFSLEDWSSTALLKRLEERKIPLFIWSKEIGWNSLYKLCRRYPSLPVILEQPEEESFWNGRLFFSLLETCKNLFLEIHNVILYLGIDEIAQRFGAERLIFGSYLPVDDPNASLMMVTDGDFSHREKEKIAHENMETLIGGVLA